MTSYEEKQAAKKQRLEDAAAKAEMASDTAYKQASAISNGIPFGQPILVGHHSEGRHRADLKRIDNGYRKSIEQSDRATELQRKADAVGTGGISSDDPDAVLKLQEKIDILEKTRVIMKQVNKAHGRYLKDNETDLSEFSEATQKKIRTYKPRSTWEPHPFSPYSFQNLGGRIRQAKKRVELLQCEHVIRKHSETKYGEVTVVENVEENRLQLFYPGKPSEEVRTKLKHNGFRWSPTTGAWQRQLNNNARWAAENVLKEKVK